MNIESDLSAYDEANTDEAKIEGHVWVPCRLCAKAFQRVRLTRRYCGSCKRAFCEGEHGSLANGLGLCVRCGPKL
jgi:hypothetical protein